MEHYSSRLYHYAFALLGQKEPAEEIVSDVFFEVWKNRKDLAQINNMDAWIQTITYRKAISFLRKETGKSDLLFDEIGEFIFDPVQSPDEEMRLFNNFLPSVNMFSFWLKWMGCLIKRLQTY